MTLFSCPVQTSQDICCVVFALFNVVWATLFLERWKRREAELAYKWGTLDTPAESLEEPRPQFRVRIGPKTCLLKWHTIIMEVQKWMFVGGETGSFYSTAVYFSWQTLTLCTTFWDMLRCSEFTGLAHRTMKCLSHLLLLLRNEYKREKEGRWGHGRPL